MKNSRLSAAVLLTAIAGALGSFSQAAMAAECAAQAKTPQAGIEDCTKALVSASDATRADLLVERGVQYRLSGDLDAAEKDIKAAIALAPEHADAHVEYGHVLRDRSMNEEALAAYTHVLSFEPENVRALLNRLDVLADLGRPQDCLAEADRVAALAPEDPFTYAFRGRCHHDVGEIEKALADYQKATSLGFEEAFLHSNLALALLETEQKQEALAAAEHAIALDPRHQHSQRSLIWTLMALGRTADAIEAFETARAYGDADEIGLVNEMAWELYKAGEYEAALPIIESFFAGDPELSEVNAYETDTYAHILAALGRVDEAVQNFMLSAQLGGEERVAHYRKALAGVDLDVGEGEEGLKAAFATCVSRGAKCRLE